MFYTVWKGNGACATGQTKGCAMHELENMQRLMKDSVLAIPFTPFSSALEGATCG
jgi:hypothetical protein